MVDALVSGNIQYTEMAEGAVENSGSSLGVTYVVDQPLPARLAIGSFYLQVFPIPFWSGLYTNSVYHLLKSLNALFMWLVVPLAVLGARRSLEVKNRQTRTTLLFLIFVYVGFTFAIAGTSLETRHLGVFLVPLLLVATIPDLRATRDARAYQKLLGAWLGMVVSVHVAWAILKIF